MKINDSKDYGLIVGNEHPENSFENIEKYFKFLMLLSVLIHDSFDIFVY